MGGKGPGRKGPVYHQQQSPRDQFDTSWRPCRGGKKAKMQIELFQRKFNEYLKEKRAPDQRPTSIEDDARSDSSGFPDFPAKLQDLDLSEEEPDVEVEVEEERVEVETEEVQPGSSSDRPKPSSALDSAPGVSSSPASVPVLSAAPVSVPIALPSVLSLAAPLAPPLVPKAS